MMLWLAGVDARKNSAWIEETPRNLAAWRRESRRGRFNAFVTARKNKNIDWAGENVGLLSVMYSHIRNTVWRKWTVARWRGQPHTAVQLAAVSRQNGRLAPTAKQRRRNDSGCGMHPPKK
ncbi:unnamed protein product [Ectocarpus fasciculatus]